MPVPSAAPAGTAESAFTDKHYRVRFRVPPGWEVARKDGQVSTFHLDARSAPASAKLRGLAMLDFNPYPYSTLAGALLYFSVEPKASDAECAAQATTAAGAAPSSAFDTTGASLDGKSPDTNADGPSAVPDLPPAAHKDVQEIAGMTFTHGHDQHGEICTEARDEVYTAWRKHTCYRFDLAINTFCAEASGARPITTEQIHDINRRMTDILSTVVLGWEKAAPHPVPVPEAPADAPREKAAPRSGTGRS